MRACRWRALAPAEHRAAAILRAQEQVERPVRKRLPALRVTRAVRQGLQEHPVRVAALAAPARMLRAERVDTRAHRVLPACRQDVPLRMRSVAAESSRTSSARAGTAECRPASALARRPRAAGSGRAGARAVSRPTPVRRARYARARARAASATAERSPRSRRVPKRANGVKRSRPARARAKRRRVRRVRWRRYPKPAARAARARTRGPVPAPISAAGERPARGARAAR